MPILFFNYHDSLIATDISYATKYSSGIDLKAYLPDGDIIVPTHGRCVIPTNLKAKFRDHDFEIQIRSRSGLAAKHGIIVLNAPGTIDADYEGEIKVILYNTSESSFTISHEMKIAQAVVSPVQRLHHYIKAEIRGEGGFGSTGV